MEKTRSHSTSNLLKAWLYNPLPNLSLTGMWKVRNQSPSLPKKKSFFQIWRQNNEAKRFEEEKDHNHEEPEP